MNFEDTTLIFSDIPYASRNFTGSYSCFNHCHRALEILYVMRGALTVTGVKETFEMKAGDVYMVLPFANHGIINKTGSQWIAVLFDLDMVGHFSKNQQPVENILATLNPHSASWPPEAREQVISLVSRMHQEYVEKTIHWQIAIKAMAIQFLITALRNFPEKETGSVENSKQTSHLTAAIEYIMANYKDGVSLPECARRIGYNSSYFSRFFHKYMGMSFTTYVNAIKIEQAKWLLLTSRLPILEVCYESGFTDVGTFNRIFKTHNSICPSTFRKSHGNQ